jgi:hypothetical protein
LLIALLFFIATMLSHFHYYSVHPFLMQKELNHSSLL